METGTSFRIDVFTPTIRHEGLKVVAACLRNQTLKDFRWVIVDKDYDLKWAKENLPEDLDILYLPEKVQNPKRKYRIMNARNTPVPFFEAPLVVEIQDYHWVPKNTLEIFWLLHQKRPFNLVSAYYAITDFKNYEKALKGEDLTDEDVNIIDRTVRYPYMEHKLVMTEPPYLGYEMNISSIPLSVLRAITPLDESFDDGYQQDPHYIALKAQEIGCPAIVTFMIKGYSFEHKLFEARPEGWQEESVKNQRLLKERFGGGYVWKDTKPGVRQEAH